MNSSYAASLINIDSASIRLSGVRFRRVLKTPSEIFSRLGSRYTKELGEHMWTLIGSASILGNPFGAIRSLKTGFADFVNEPMDSIQNDGSLMGFGGSLARGGKSLVTHSLSGTG